MRLFMEAIEEVRDPLLTNEEREALLTREDKGIEPVEIRSFKDVDSFREGSNNFFLTFAAVKESEEWFIKRRTKAFQRLEILNPDLVDSLTRQLQGKWRQNKIDDAGWAGLFEAYRQLSQLVDINDPHVVRGGVVDDLRFCR